MTPALEPANVELVKRLRADNDWLMRSRFVGHELRALEAGNTNLEAASRIEALAHQLGEMQRAVDEARHEVWNLGLCVGQIAKWPRTHFHRFYVEEWVIRTATILRRWGDVRGAIDVLNVTSHHTRPNKRLAAEAAALRTASGDGDGR